MMTANNAETVNELNKEFQSVFVNESDLDIPTYGEMYDGSVLENIKVNVTTVSDLLKKVNVHKSLGPDGNHPKFLNECHD